MGLDQIIKESIREVVREEIQAALAQFNKNHNQTR